MPLEIFCTSSFRSRMARSKKSSSSACAAAAELLLLLLGIVVVRPRLPSSAAPRAAASLAVRRLISARWRRSVSSIMDWSCSEARRKSRWSFFLEAAMARSLDDGLAVARASTASARILDLRSRSASVADRSNIRDFHMVSGDAEEVFDKDSRSATIFWNCAISVESFDFDEDGCCCSCCCRWPWLLVVLVCFLLAVFCLETKSWRSLLCLMVCSSGGVETLL
mmetsp:Transcript_917/g.2240  ORF Transcript_917/g.2240 Transcript_917/m.2240 type:complete len:223 (+) Transcript_917:1360-2028(+)